MLNYIKKKVRLREVEDIKRKKITFKRLKSIKISLAYSKMEMPRQSIRRPFGVSKSWSPRSL